MYQDKQQWVRLAYVAFNAVVVFWLIQPKQIEQYLKWDNGIEEGATLPLIQLTLFLISIGLILPKSKYFEPLGRDGRITSDFRQLIIGVPVSAVAWGMSLLG